jgi:hypothetical protein
VDRPGIYLAWADPNPDSSDTFQRSKRAQAHGQALQEQVARVAEAVAETEQDLARVHRGIADQGGVLAAEAREHADRAGELAANERAEAERLRRAGSD